MSDKWRDKLSEQEYQITREAGTERPFTGILLDEQRDGIYVCKCCGAPLFPSETKFDAGCGWPSFYKQSTDDNVGYREDDSHGMRRVEIFCKQCDAHLGHVFPDGPEPTGQRYCVNSVSMTFKSGDDEVRG
ncbi:peptide-methionine (R)-S-oxide reductase MsrB [Alteromonas sp. ASW11-19]|uniref:Peptide methionine sulfoxide reductase MsrB n=1 Tax=Alteromonas salexigens TaxID=2982530 RepID=A0ABT2VM11_9ALTE|nr:peptide-methionine (R)-S-oxide reductase MsrB [Alteromonas salexigens]MCU7554358.1 peptide-methionine (R)-S-oxide reductase MsrB [Alteromonas salexigens]